MRLALFARVMFWSFVALRFGEVVLYQYSPRPASYGTIVVVGVCMQPDRINPFIGISKELNIQFVLGYDPMEFAGSLRSIAEGEIDVAPMITAEVDLDGVPRAFEDLGDPEEHCKILVVP